MQYYRVENRKITGLVLNFESEEFITGRKFSGIINQSVEWKIGENFTYWNVEGRWARVLRIGWFFIYLSWLRNVG